MLADHRRQRRSETEAGQRRRRVVAPGAGPLVSTAQRSNGDTTASGTRKDMPPG